MPRGEGQGGARLSFEHGSTGGQTPPGCEISSHARESIRALGSGNPESERGACAGAAERRGRRLEGVGVRTPGRGLSHREQRCDALCWCLGPPMRGHAGCPGAAGRRAPRIRTADAQKATRRPGVTFLGELFEDRARLIDRGVDEVGMFHHVSDYVAIRKVAQSSCAECRHPTGNDQRARPLRGRPHNRCRARTQNGGRIDLVRACRTAPPIRLRTVRRLAATNRSVMRSGGVPPAKLT